MKFKLFLMTLALAFVSSISFANTQVIEEDACTKSATADVNGVSVTISITADDCGTAQLLALDLVAKL